MFAGNNPASYTDPFGLCTPPSTCRLLAAAGVAALADSPVPGSGDVVAAGLLLAAAGTKLHAAKGEIEAAVGKAVDKVTKAVASLQLLVELATGGHPKQEFDPEPPPKKDEAPRPLPSPRTDGGGGEPPKKPGGPIRVDPDGTVHFGPRA